jgi:hypothetical protein
MRKTIPQETFVHLDSSILPMESVPNSPDDDRLYVVGVSWILIGYAYGYGHNIKLTLTGLSVGLSS